MLGLDASSETTKNLLRTGECVLNLASDDMTANVNAIARTTGTEEVPEMKVKRGYVHCKDKFGTAGLTELKSKIVEAPGIQECPVSMEAKLVAVHEMFGKETYQGLILAVEVEVLAVSVHEELKLDGYQNRINAEAWKPLIMMFSDFFGLKEKKLVAKSQLAEIEEESYRLPGHTPNESTMANRDESTQPGDADFRVDP